MKKLTILFFFFSSFILSDRLSLECNSSKLDSIKIVNKEVIADGIKILPTFAPFLMTDSYSNVTTRDCKKSVCAEVYNRKWCKNPKDTFIVKSLNDKNSVFILSNRCDGGFKKFSSPSFGKQEFPIKLLDDGFLFQVKNQIHAGTAIQRSPAIIIDEDEEGIFVTVKDFTDDDWDVEWTREDISLSYFTINEGDAFSFNSRCKIK